MTSTITHYSSLIDTTFPVPGQDNDTSGFRSNYINIQQSLLVASSEITELQYEQSGILTQLNESLISNNSLIIQTQGTTLTNTATVLNFTGTGVSIIDNNGIETINISGNDTSIFSTISDASASNISTNISSVSTLGASSIGDGGSAYYIVVSNLQVGGFQSADGRYWGISPNQIITPEMFGALSTQSTSIDDHAAIQNMITYLGTIGIGCKTLFWPKQYGLGVVGINITYNGIILSGTVGPTAGEATAVGTQFIYSGTGSAVSIGQTSTFIFRAGLENISIVATGSAAASSSAVGVTMRNGQYCIFKSLSIKSFGGGIGFLDLADGATYYSASCSMYDPSFWGNYIGFRSTTINSGVGTNAFSWFNGFVIGTGNTTGIGIDLLANAKQFAFYGTDNESAQILWNITGQGHRFLGTRSEFSQNHIVMNTGSIHNIFVAHAVSTGGGESIYIDNGTDNHYIGSGAGSVNNALGNIVLQPSADRSEVFQVVNAANQSVFDISTNATPRVEMPFGRNLIMYSDNYSTATINANGANGSLTISGTLQAATGTFSSYVVGTNLIAHSAAVAFGTGYVSIGNTTATNATSGTAAILPSAPLGYLICAINSSTVKIPYYNV